MGFTRMLACSWPSSIESAHYQLVGKVGVFLIERTCSNRGNTVSVIIMAVNEASQLFSRALVVMAYFDVLLKNLQRPPPPLF